MFHLAEWDSQRKSLLQHCSSLRTKAVTSQALTCPLTAAWDQSDVLAETIKSHDLRPRGQAKGVYDSDWTKVDTHRLSRFRKSFTPPLATRAPRSPAARGAHPY